jgi:hypothetical protein
MAKGPRPVFDYEGDGLFRAEKRFHWQCDQDYVVGLKYRMDVIEERSVNSHSHFFAAVTEAWNNLPEDQTGRFPSPEHLRKWALIQCNYCHTAHKVFSTKQDSLTAAAMLRAADRYSVITVSDNILTVYTAESQSYKAMGKERFQQSKEKVLELLASMIQVTPKQLQYEAVVRHQG